MNRNRSRTLLAIFAAAGLASAITAALLYYQELCLEWAMHHNNLGVALLEGSLELRGHAGEAAREFEEALRLKPDYRLARLNLGIAWNAAGEHPRAVNALEEFLRDEPDNLSARFTLGLALEMSQRPVEAKIQFQQVVAADPGDFHTWVELGNCWGAEGRHDEAIQAYRRAEKINSHDVQLYYMQYVVFNRAKRWEKAQAVWEKLRKLKEFSKISLSDLRGRVGKYARPIADSRRVLPAPEPAPQYAEAAAELGIAAAKESSDPDLEVQQILRGKPVSRLWFGGEKNRSRFLSAFAAGASFADFDNDGKLDIFMVRGEGKYALLRQNASGRFEEAAAQAGLCRLPRLGMSASWGDVDNDGWSDLFIAGYGEARLYRNQNGVFVDVTENSGIAAAVEPGAWCYGAALADLDHDADLDLAVTCLFDLELLPEKNELRFPGDFEPLPRPLLLFRNNRDGTFTEVAGKLKLADPMPLLRGLTCSDLNGDGVVDLLLVDFHGKAHLWLNRLDGGFELSEMVLKEPPPLLPPGESQAFGDYDGDGTLDRLTVKSGAGAALSRNVRRPANWLTVRVRGLCKPGMEKSNRLGIGSRVEVRAVGRWQVKELRAGNGRSGCDAAEITFNLGPVKKLDFVRVFFTSGMRAAVKEVDSNQVITIEEPLVNANSCPLVFAWSGESFEFIADALSAGILGELVAPGEYWRPDPDEWLRIPGEKLKPRTEIAEGRSRQALELRFANALEEVTYLDQARLVAVDHPQDLHVYPGERMVNDPANREAVKFYALKSPRPLVWAADGTGADVTSLLSKIDRAHAGPRELLPFKGFAREWSLTLDLGAAREEHPVLLLHGWSDWNSSASAVAAAQARVALWGPSLEVQAADGSWRAALEDLGVPAGLPRAILIDLEGLLRPGERTLRIRTNRMLYFDQALVAEGMSAWSPEGEKPPDPLRFTEIPLARAELRRLGHPRRLFPEGRSPETFDYQQIEPEAEWGSHRGLLTRYGEVTALLASRDDRFAILEHGEEVALSFAGQSLPPLPEGWERTWLFYCDGYEKGLELHSACSRTVEPLPFHAMKSYPYPEGEQPLTGAQLEYQLEWNVRQSY
ncbi:MAG: VCBS repeat-containing protein [Planctomycetes bacterium]|nr:VCBS repeat-containing protein [Planctomycetota bacterium]